MMRVTSAGSCETILCNCPALLRGFSTVVIMRAVTSGRVAIVVTFLTASMALACGSRSVAVDIGIVSPVLSRRGSGDLRGLRTPEIGKGWDKPLIGLWHRATAQIQC